VQQVVASFPVQNRKGRYTGVPSGQTVQLLSIALASAIDKKGTHNSYGIVGITLCIDAFLPRDKVICAGIHVPLNGVSKPASALENTGGVVTRCFTVILASIIH
jgi:hypothetical protein